MSLNKASWRRATQAFIFALSGLFTTAITTPIFAQTNSISSVTIQQTNSSIELVPAPDKSVVEFDFNAKVKLGEAKAKSDIVDLGLIPTGEYGTVRELIVEGDYQSVLTKVNKSNSKAKNNVKLKPLYYVEGRVSEKTRVTLQERLVIKFKENIGLDDKAEIENDFDLEINHVMTNQMIDYNVDLFSSSVPDLAQQISEQNQDIIEFVEPVFASYKELHGSTALPITDTDDPLRELQWHHNNDGRVDISRGTMFDADHDIWRAWNPNTRNVPFGSRGDDRSLGYYGRPTSVSNVLNGTITVAVFDSGTDLEHEDWLRNTEDADPDPGGSSVIDPRTGVFDRIDNDPNPTHNGDAHGTAVAGIITAARNNSTGASGIAPDLTLLSYRVVETGAAASDADIATGITSAAGTLVADLGNHSWGGLLDSDVLRAAFQFAQTSGRFNLGMANFTSSGNDTTFMSYPALFPSTFSVGGVDRNGDKTGYASWGGRLDFVGSTSQNVILPGEDTLPIRQTEGIVTTDISGPGGYVQSNPNDELVSDGNYVGFFNGTSASSPVITGVAALILAEDPSLTTFELFTQMANTADKVDDPLMYVGLDNQANRNQLVFEVTEFDPETMEEVITTTPLVMKFGRPNNFRALDYRYSADGWSPFFGYGRPNPYNQITQQIANIGPRDYIDISDDSTFLGETNPFVDAGDLVLVYSSRFETDYDIVLAACFDELSNGGEEEVDPVDLAECIRNDAEDVSPWLFSQSNTIPDGDGAPIIEVGYETPDFVYGAFTYEFFYGAGENEISIPNIDSLRPALLDPKDCIPVILTSSRQTRGGETLSSRRPIGITATDGDDYWNPRGRYLSDTQISIENRDGSIALPVDRFSNDDHMFLDVTLRHEMGIENTTDYAVNNRGIDPVRLFEIDMIEVSYNNVPIGYIYGNSDNLPVFPLPLPLPYADRIVVDDFFDFPNFIDDPLARFNPERGIQNMPLRTYRFTVPKEVAALSIEEPSISFEIVHVKEHDGSINQTGNFFSFKGRGFANEGNNIDSGTGSNIVAEFVRDDAGIITDQFTVPGTNRDFPGFEIAHLKIWGVDNLENEETSLTGSQLVDQNIIKVADNGTRPEWSVDTDEIFYIDSEDAGFTANQIRVAEADGLFTALDPVITDFFSPRGVELYLRERTNVKLLETVSESPDSNATPPPIISFDVDENSNKIVYVIDDPFAMERVFIATDDGIFERPLFPATNGVSRDLDINDVEFGRVSDELFVATDEEIFSTDETGNLRDTIVDIANSKLTNFNDVTLFREDSMIIFSAENVSGDRGVYLAVRNINTPGAPGFIIPIIDWPGSDEVHPTIQATGSVLVFASNTIDQNGGTIPGPDQINQLYAVSNINTLIDFGVTPSVSSDPLILQRDRRIDVDKPNAYAGGQYPKYSSDPNNFTIVFEGLDNAQSTRGEIARTTVTPPFAGGPAVQPRFPTPDPGITPPPTPEAAPDDQIIQTSRSDFDFQGDGWVLNAGDLFGVPQQPPLSSTAGGALTLISFQNNVNTFGLFTSEERFLRLNQEEGSLTQTSLSNHYLVRYYARRTVEDPTRAATFVGRVTSDDGQNVQEVRVQSTTPTNPYMPDFDTFTTVDFLFHPNVDIFNQPLNELAYQVQFGIENFDIQNDASAGYLVDRVDIFRLDPATVEEVGTIQVYEFDDQDDIDSFAFMGSGIFGDPDFDTDNGSLSISINNESSNFGSFVTQDGAVIANPVGVSGELFVRMRVDLSTSESNGQLVPDLQFTLTDLDNSFEQTNRVVGVADADQIPSSGNNKSYYTYFPVDESFTNELFELDAMWDAFSINQSGGNGTSSTPINLERVEFDLIRIDGFPADDPTVNQ